MIYNIKMQLTVFLTSINLDRIYQWKINMEQMKYNFNQISFQFKSYVCKLKINLRIRHTCSRNGSSYDVI